MRKPKRPLKVVNDLITLLDVVLGDERYPVNVEQLALDYSRKKFSNDYIKDIKGDNLPGFEGALYEKKKNDESRWLILYNDQITKPERINFTLAHEFGHYLLHRDEQKVFECSQEDLSRFNDCVQRETEANTFASQLLMPLHDFRKQVDANELSFDLMEHCTYRYQVSLTAAILKWIEFTAKRAMMVVSRDEYILWARSSQPAFKSGVYIKTVGCPPVAVPEKSLANQRSTLSDSKVETQHPEGVWRKDEPVKELTVFSDKFDLVITLLIFPDEAPNRFIQDEEEPKLMDTYQKFTNNL